MFSFNIKTILYLLGHNINVARVDSKMLAPLAFSSSLILHPPKRMKETKKKNERMNERKKETKKERNKQRMKQTNERKKD